MAPASDRGTDVGDCSPSSIGSAARLLPATTGALSRRFSALSTTQQTEVMNLVDELPADIITLDSRTVVPVMSALSSVAPANVLTAEAVATASGARRRHCRLGAIRVPPENERSSAQVRSCSSTERYRPPLRLYTQVALVRREDPAQTRRTEIRECAGRRYCARPPTAGSRRCLRRSCSSRRFVRAVVTRPLSRPDSVRWSVESGEYREL